MSPEDPFIEHFAKLEKPAGLSRRQFLIGMSVAMGAIAAVLVSIPIVGALFSPLIKKQKEIWRSVGSLGDFPVGQTVKVTFLDASPLPWAGVSAKTAAWLRRDPNDQFIAFSINCTHLGCPVRWIPSADLFMCPCHGGVYNDQGNVVAGPPPKPLGRYPVRVRSGLVEIQTSPIPISTT